MRTLILGTLSFVLGLGMLASCQAQGLGVNFGKDTAPVMTKTVLDFHKLKVVGFAGAQLIDGAIHGGGALTYDLFELKGPTDRLTVFAGISATFSQGKPVSGGLVLGVRF